MKLHITDSHEEPIKGYTHVVINNSISVAEGVHIPRHGCEEIFAPDVIDYIPNNNVDEFIEFCASKLRLNGELKLSGIDPNMLALQMMNKKISEQTFAQVVAQINNISNPYTLIERCTPHGLKPKHMTFRGYQYEIILTRG